MRLYGDYLNIIERVAVDSVLSLSDKRNNYFSKSLVESRLNSYKNDSEGIKPQVSLKQIADLLGIKEIKSPQLGDHPDFAHLRQDNGSEYHNIVSVFIDLKKSTNLFRNYTHEQISFVIQTIQLASTHTCALLGGKIQRMQYDGVFVYFGGKGIKKEDAIKSAMIATSLFSYFVKYELKQVFQQKEIERIFTRIGIDFGDDKDVYWSIYGSGDCTELTTTSLHTSLAPKMQSNADSNGIVIGNNVRERLGIDEHHCEVLRDENGNFNYIFRDPDYKQHKFNWGAFLCNTYPFFKRNGEGSIYIDYNSAVETKERLAYLSNSVSLLNTSTAYLHKNNDISALPNSNKIPKNSFYFE